jgi:hypothetical protein
MSENERTTDPCPHDCATGIGRVTTFDPPWTGTIWECTVCRATGEDTADNTAIVWQQAGQLREWETNQNWQAEIEKYFWEQGIK